MGDFDAIVVGSGIGGLAAAALLARLEGKRVLVLERHWRAGGFTHTFERPGGFRWDVGLHYVGDLSRGLEGDVFRLVTGAAVRWTRMADPFERLVFPGLSFDIRTGREVLAGDLGDRFPDEAPAIGRFLDDVDRAAAVRFLPVWRALAPAPVAWLAERLQGSRLRLARTTTREVLEARFRSPELRAILGARWGDHGLPPGQSAFGAHAVICQHYFRGGHYPAGSAAAIADGARAVVEAAGGRFRVRAPVERILIRAGRAAGVRLEGGEEITAPLVISDAGARNTYLKLLPDDFPLPFRAELSRLPAGGSALCLYLGLSRSPRELGVHGENLWLHDALDQDGMAARWAEALEGRPPLLYASFPSLKDPLAEGHTAEVLAPAEASAFARWAGTRWRKRGAEYEALKERVADGMLAALERAVPGIAALVVHRELSTPLTTEGFSSHPGGEIYGIPFGPERLGLRWLGVRTPLRGLFLAGADALFLGIVGAMMGGAMAAAAAVGPSLVARIRRGAARVRSAAN